MQCSSPRPSSKERDEVLERSKMGPKEREEQRETPPTRCRPGGKPGLPWKPRRPCCFSLSLVIFAQRVPAGFHVHGQAVASSASKLIPFAEWAWSVGVGVGWRRQDLRRWGWCYPNIRPQAEPSIHQFRFHLVSRPCSCSRFSPADTPSVSPRDNCAFLCHSIWYHDSQYLLVNSVVLLMLYRREKEIAPRFLKVV